MEVYYLNSGGTKKLNLTAWPYRLQIADLFSYDWEYESAAAQGNGGTVTRFHRSQTELSLTLGIAARSMKEFYQALNELFETAERDVLQKTPGRLYLGDQYLTCYIKGSKQSDWPGGVEFLTKSLTLIIEYPFWCTERKYSYTANGISCGSGEDYPYDYPYDFINVLENSTIHNNHFRPCHFELTVYGPCEKPAVYIGGHLYQADVSLQDKEYLKVSSREGTVCRVKADGEKVNEFNSRNKKSSIFEQIPTGAHSVSWNGDFGFDMNLLEDRSEPKWIL